MAAETVTLHLSEAVAQRAHQAAAALQHPLEDVLVEMLEAALPDVADAPNDLQAELVRMTWLSDQRLWEIARSTLFDAQASQLAQLAELQAQRSLNAAEQHELESLRHAYGETMLRKARAYALLSLRGGTPLLHES